VQSPRFNPQNYKGMGWEEEKKRKKDIFHANKRELG
jgi:hypothetical protein